MLEALIAFAGTAVGVALTLTVQWYLAQQQIRAQFRLAAVDKRLEKHQEAYALWHRLVSAVHKPDARGTVVAQCQTWWTNNSLYLTTEAREAFRWAFLCASDYDAKDPEMREEWWPQIMAPGRVIPAAVCLPALGDERLDNPEAKDAQR